MLLFLVSLEVKIFTRFDVFLDFVILVYFNTISIDFYAVKSFICIMFCGIAMFISGRMHIGKLLMLEEF